MSPASQLARRIAYAFLTIVPLLVAVTTVRLLRIPGVHQAIAGVLATAIGVAAWTLGARAIRAGKEEPPGQAIPGVLLVSSWAVLSLVFPGLGPPWMATAAENQLRYVALLIAGALIVGGFVALKEALTAAGGHPHSTLGFAATMLAGPTSVIFATIQIHSYRAMERAGSGQEAPWIASLDELSILLLFFGAMLSYVAAAAFAAALGRTLWLGRAASRVFVGTSLFALLCVGIKVAVVLGSPQDPMWAFKTWYTIPGLVLSIPAIPLLVPYLIGVNLLRRAGHEQRRR
jgi:hypothetical protein